MTPILHVRIPGEPVAQERHRWAKGHTYDPSAAAKKTFTWQVKAACPLLKPTEARLAVIVEIWSRKKVGDVDNFFKFCADALTGLAWADDVQIEDGRCIVHRGALEPATEILVWELP